MKAILTLDIGTTACKSMVFDTNGKILAEESQEYPIYQEKPTWAQQNPDEWWGAVISTVKKCIASLKEEPEIVAIGLSSQRETVVPVDKNGEKLDDAILWMDRRAKEQAEELAEYYGKENLHRITGMIPDSTFTATKLLWYKRNRPEIIKRAYKFLQPKEYIAYKLTGEYATDYSLASRTMMLDVKSRSWFKDIFDYIGVDIEQLPPIKHSDEIAGYVKDEAAALLGIKSGIPVVVGGGDRQCEALGAGIFGNRAMESTGTTTNVSMGTDKFVEEIDERVIISCHVLRDHWLIEQGMTTSGTINRWYRDNFCAIERLVASDIGERDYAIIDKELAMSPPGANKLLLLPFFMGAKSTRWNSNARGVLLGLTLNTQKRDIGRAILEGVAYEIRACLDILKSMGLSIDEIVVMGGGAKGALWNQIKADVCGRPIRVPMVTDAASLGAMILAGTGVGVFDDAKACSKRLNNIVKEYLPDEDNYKLYSKLYSIYNELYEVLEPIYNKLANI
ncbi:xylulokinase [Caldanaerobius fijiensis DSM 17918]|uniref:Xylulose kinase n=1 Tax=Caldanaerobius fijiensis DSM 17918 TaxID=1121256 RepID=A0A1M4W000_9THEO|nr:xylulokinase [Caldanaerobius fijiensis]SHE74624.1 xylulokinase [Caldanaerobius fijiensis DSM 17918]